MSNEAQPKSPNTLLSESIVARLAEKELILPDDESSVLKALCSGNAKVTDWNRWVENKLDRLAEGRES